MLLFDCISNTTEEAHEHRRRPILPEKLDRWNALAAEHTRPRSADWEDYLRRYGLTRHVAFLVPTVAGQLAVLFMEGPGAATLMARFATSDQPFDRRFRAELAECHGIDFSGPPPTALPEFKGEARV